MRILPAIYFLAGSLAAYGWSPGNEAKDKINFDSLIQKSDAVVLMEEKIVEINDENSALYTYHIKVLVKNPHGEGYNDVRIDESIFEEIDDISAFIKDTLDNVIKELQPEKIEHLEILPGSSYTNEKYSRFSLKYNSYPYIFEYSLAKKLNTLLFWPGWYPECSYPSLYSSYRLILHSPVKFNTYSMGLDIKPVKQVLEEDTTYFWETRNIPEFLSEDFMPPENRLQKILYFAPEKFSADEYEGSCTSWGSFAQWIKKLSAGRYNLPEKAKNEISELIKGINEPKEKIKILYKYLQENTRYVALEFGISGFQPHSAADVYENHYGDCKDLSTFMISLLDAAGIKGYYALAKTRDRGVVNAEFPSNQFNHVIVMVPLKDDTLWLECTANYSDMEDSHYHIEDIYALVINDDTGELIKTAKTTAEDNREISKIEGKLDKDGNLVIDGYYSASGNDKNYFKHSIITKNRKEDLLFLQDLFGEFYKNLDIEEYTVSDLDNQLYKVDVNGIYKKFSSVKGSRIFINPNIFNRITGGNIPKEKPEERKYPVYYSYPFLQIDSVLIEVPQGYILETQPSNSNISTSFADYTAEYEVKDGRLIYSRKYKMKRNLVPLSSYKEYLDFQEKVLKSDKSSFVLVRKG